MQCLYVRISTQCCDTDEFHLVVIEKFLESTASGPCGISDFETKGCNNFLAKSILNNTI